MGQTGLDAQKGATILRTAVEKYNSTVSYPKTVIGQSLRDGDLTLGNLTYTNDFRSTYSTILERWFGVEAKPIVNGTFEPLAFV